MKKFLSGVFVICLLFSFVACSNELERMEGKFYAEENLGYYIELKKDGMFEVYDYWSHWWDDEGKRHEICTGTYKIYKGIKETNYTNYINIYFSDDTQNRKGWLWGEYINYYIINENILSEYSDGHSANYIKS